MMNTKRLKYSILLAMVFVIGVFGTVYAQGPSNPEAGPADGEGNAPIHDILIQAFADSVGKEVSAIEARLEAGETLFDIAASYGYTVENFTQMMTSARTQAREEAIAAGLIVGRGGRWSSDSTFSGGYGNAESNGFGTGDGTCLSEDGEPLNLEQQLGDGHMGRGGRWNQ